MEVSGLYFEREAGPNTWHVLYGTKDVAVIEKEQARVYAARLLTREDTRFFESFTAAYLWACGEHYRTVVA